MLVTTGHLHLKLVKALNFQNRILDSDLLGGFNIKAISSAFPPVEVD